MGKIRPRRRGWDLLRRCPEIKKGMHMVTVSTACGSAEILPRTAIVGVGGAGCRIASAFYDSLTSADIIAVNTHRKSLEDTDADVRIFICRDVVKGKGTGGDSALGRKCARIHSEEIRNALKGHDIAVIVAGMGGGTGSGAAAVVAEISQSLGIITMAVVVKPFSFEGNSRTAAEGLRSLRAVCPSTIAVENDIILEKFPDMTLNEAFGAVNESIVDYVKRKTDFAAENFAKELKKSGPGNRTSGRNVPAVTDGLTV
jgi:cell division protein FtsZ